MHLGGKIEQHNKHPAQDPRRPLDGLHAGRRARLHWRSHEDRDKAFQYTIKRNTVAVVSDGTRGARPRRHRPRGRDAGDGGQGDALQGVRRRRRVPDLPRHQGPRRDRRDRRGASRPRFGGINLEDISAPRCFEIEDRLKAELDIPVFHDDQHGTAVVVLAALLNALKLTGKRLEDLRVLVVGLGAAGVAVTKILLAGGRARRRSAATRAARCTPSAPTTSTARCRPIKRWYAEVDEPRAAHRRRPAT